MALLDFNWVDITISGIVLLSIIISLARGFVREALSLLTWAVAFWLALSFSPAIASKLQNHIATPSLRTITAFGVLFVGALLLGGIVNRMLALLIAKTGLSGMDRILGAIFGFARGLLLTAVLLLLAKLTPLSADPWWKASALIPRLEPLEIWLTAFLPKKISEEFNRNQTG